MGTKCTTFLKQELVGMVWLRHQPECEDEVNPVQRGCGNILAFPRASLRDAVLLCSDLFFLSKSLNGKRSEGPLHDVIMDHHGDAFVPGRQEFKTVVRTPFDPVLWEIGSRTELGRVYVLHFLFRRRTEVQRRSGSKASACEQFHFPPPKLVPRMEAEMDPENLPGATTIITNDFLRPMHPCQDF